jgi:hypothetical protein
MGLTMRERKARLSQNLCLERHAGLPVKKGLDSAAQDVLVF